MPNFELRAMVDKLRCRCRFGMREAADSAAGAEWAFDPDGCPAVLAPSDVAEHEKACAFELVPCGNAGRDGARCEVQFRRGESAAHQAACALRPLPCGNGCGKQLPLCDQAEHEANECPRALVDCEFAGCGATFLRSNRQRHYRESMADHLVGETRARLAYRRAGLAEIHASGLNPMSPIITMLNNGVASADEVQSGLWRLVPILTYFAGTAGQFRAIMCAAVLKAMCTHSADADVQIAGLACLDQV